MSPIGDLARQDDYDLPDVGPPLIPSGPQFSPGVPAVNQAMGSLLAPRQRDENSPVAYRTASPLVNITEQDIADATEAAMASSGGGLGIKAYHGSPYDFEKFDLSKIGTGEGAQAYGHGLYFAESEPVARSYRDALSGKADNGKVLSIDGQRIQAPTPAMNFLNRHQWDVDKAVDAMQPRLSAATDKLKTASKMEVLPGVSDYDIAAVDHKYMHDFVNELQSYRGKNAQWVDPGHMYEVDIKADPAHFLDWDKPLAQQPHATDLMKQFYPGLDPAHMGINDLRNALRTETIAKDAAKAGIPGIKYLDQQSRVVPGQVSINRRIMNDPSVPQAMRDQAKVDLAKWERENQTSNYVVFNPAIIDILRKYGIAGAAPLGMGALAAQDQYNQP